MLTLRVINRIKHYKILQHFSLINVKSISIDRPVLYGDEVSPPVRFVLMTASFLNIEIKFHEIDLFKNENRTDFYRKINPLLKVPAMQVGDARILDSHAIALYLCQIAKNQSLYPENPILRAKVNEILFYNSSTLFRIDSYILSNYFARQWPVSKQIIEEWNTALDYLEHHLESDWLTGHEMFLCDICAFAVVTSVIPLVPLTKRHKRVSKWIENFEDLPIYRINKRGIMKLNNYIEVFRNNST